MITEEIIDALNIYQSLCKANRKDSGLVERVIKMLSDYSEDEWCAKSDAEKVQWVMMYI